MPAGSRTVLLILGLFLVTAAVCRSAPPADKAPPAATLEHFEKKVRPLLAARCWKCHGPDKAKAGLRLDTRDGLVQGGESGAVVVPGRPDDSRLVRAVRQTGVLKMPPDDKLKAQEIADLVAWVKAGAVWPNDPVKTPVPVTKGPATVPGLAPNDPTLRSHLQAWYRADALPLTDGKAVHVWPDASGRGRDLSATAGVRAGGVGTAPRFVAAGGVNRRPAVRFDVGDGLAGSPDHPVDIRGDAAVTLFLVVNLKRHDAQPPYDGILGIGNPANPGGDPGRPLAYLVQIRRTPEPELQFAGGWNHDATLGPGSFQSLYDRPVLLSFVKMPGPMKNTTRIFIDGVPSAESPIKRPVQGRDTVPDIRHRDDIGLYMGKALAWSGHIRGDVSEAIIYNRALSDSERKGVQSHLAERFGMLAPLLKLSEARFTAEQKSFWSFQRVKDPAPPAVRGTSWPKSPLDRFILAKLESAGLGPAPAADKRTLLRRVTFDLTGLPPTPQEMDAFLADHSPDAFAKVVDRLLASPHYGERWARHWLDVVRYADTTANDANAVMRYAFRYRDYVVAAFNQDKPYDQFIIEQLAGDLLPADSNPRRAELRKEPGYAPPTTRPLTRLGSPGVPATAERVIATGFLMVGPKALAEPDIEQSRMDIVDDQIDTTGRAFLGLTLGCARCHDHKFDPVPAVDYYSLAGIFRGAEVFKDEVRNATMFQEWPLFQLPGDKAFVVMAPKEGTPKDLRVHIRGNRHNLGHVTPRRFLQIIAGAGHAPLKTTQSGRLELARWIAGKDNPLTARVLVNRLWQHHFGAGLVATSDNFGSRGERPTHPELLDWLATRFIESGWSIKAMQRLMVLSATYQQVSNTEGGGGNARSAGFSPSLPERAKARTTNKNPQLVDPNNRLLWRMPRRRLEAEALRDAVLAVSGQLDRAVGGDDAAEFLFREGEVIDKKRDFFRPNRVKAEHPYYLQSKRRSLYLPVVRNALPDVLALFDAADPNGITAARNDTTVPAQALYMLNNPFVREQALHCARSLLADPQATDPDRLGRAHARAFGRPPTAEELQDGTAYLRDYVARTKGRSEADSRLAAWQSYCQMLFCANEFLYVD